MPGAAGSDGHDEPEGANGGAAGRSGRGRGGRTAARHDAGWRGRDDGPQTGHAVHGRAQPRGRGRHDATGLPDGHAAAAAGRPLAGRRPVHPLPAERALAGLRAHAADALLDAGALARRLHAHLGRQHAHEPRPAAGVRRGPAGMQFRCAL